MTIPLVPILDMPPYIGQRSASFIFRLSDGVTGQNLGLINPLSSSPPSLTHDTSRTIKRQLSPLNLGARDSARINPIRQRVTVSMMIKNTEYPLGRYIFTDATSSQWTSGDLMSCSLVDEMFLIDQEMEQGFSVNTGNSETVESAIRRLLAVFTNIKISIQPSASQATGSWSAGTSRAKVLGDLCTQGGYFQPWFDNQNILRIIQSFEPASAIPNIDFDLGKQVMRASISKTNDLLSSPNRFIVIGNSTTGSSSNLPAVGTYNVPNSAPHSAVNRGFVIPDVRDIQVKDSTQAQAAANAIGISETVFERVQLDTVIDPRHDSYDVIRWQEEQWLELSWSMQLSPGAPMRHLIRKAYS